MKINRSSYGGFINSRALLGVALCSSGLLLALSAFHILPEKAAAPNTTVVEPEHFMPVPGGKKDDLDAIEAFWNDRLTYPTGRFNAAWLRQAAVQDARVPRGVPGGRRAQLKLGVSPLALSPTSFTALGPKPERMTGCSGCFDYTTTEGRINAIVVDPTTTTNGSIVAYAGSVGGGVWKTTNCCSAATTWNVTTDDPLISATSIDTLAIDPNDHNTIYAGTGDLNYGSFSMGSQGILKSTDGGATWVVLGADVFGPGYVEPPGQFPQYDAVGKVRVDPNNSNNVVAGTKRGLFFSYDGGVNWTGPCTTNNFSTQRQDITGLELSNMGGGVTRILAAVGVRGFATTVQYDLGNNGANGLYSANMGASGCPTFASIASNANGFVYGTTVANSPYATGANMNAGSGNPWVSATSGNQLGRIDIAVAPSNPNVVYAQVQSIAINTSSGCGSANGCQIGAWASTNGGATWSFMAGSQGPSLRQCASSGAGSGTNGSGDYPQNWYDQGVAVDPNNADRVFFDTFDVWLANRTGTAWYDVTCGYSGVNPKPVHVDQHALAFVPGSSSILLLGNDGGAHGTVNANAAADGVLRPTWFNMDSGFNTIEFYNGDIGPNFATSATPYAAGGAQDNMDSFVSFTGSPTGPVQWQGNIGGDGFFARLDGKGGYFYASNNNGAIHRCTGGNPTCTTTAASWSGDIRATTVRNDRQSFVMPFELFRGNPAGTGNAECGTRCNHMLVGTYRVWETVNSDGTTITWSARTADLTKNTLGNRSFINNLHYSPANQTLAIVATNDGNVQALYGLGGTTTAVNLTGSNVVLPNRPILDVAFDPASNNTVASPMIGYAAVGGFNANTPSTPGHVFRVVCNVNCTSFAWTDKTGNLPDIPVDSIIANPNFPMQVFAGTDFGLYYTDDITANPPVWSRFENGLPHAMVWSLSIDRGNTALSVWTRSRGAYAWPLPTGPQNPLPTVLSVASATGTYGGTANLSATLTSGGNPVSGKSIAFTINGNTVGNATTDGNGVANLNNASLDSYNAGTYPSGVGASFAGDTIYAAAAGTNNLTINKKDATWTTNPNSKTYGDNDPDPLTTGSGSGFIGSDNVTATYARDPGETVTGSPYHITATLSPSDRLDNYNITNNGADFTINRKNVTASITAENKTYDGNDTASITECSVPDKFDGDDLGCTASNAHFSDANAADGKTVTADVTATGTSAGNYTLASPASTTANIARKDATWTTNNSGKTYGDPDPNPLTTGSGAGFIASDGITASYNRAPGENVTGSPYHISATLSPSDKLNNYNITNNGADFVITKASSTTTVTVSNATYDGNPHGGTAVATGGGGFSQSQTVYYNGRNSTVYGPTVTPPTNAGDYTASATFAGDDNHTGSNDSKDYSIFKASSTTTVTVSNATFDNNPHGGTAVATGAGGLNQNLDVTYTGRNGTVYGPTTSAPTNAGDYTASATFDGDENHTGSNDSKDYSIYKANTTTTVALLGISPNPTPQFSDTVALSATVTPSSSGAFSGTISFTFNGASAGSAPVSDTMPTAQVTVKLDNVKIPSGAGNYNISATFTPDAGSNFNGSASGTQSAAVKHEGEDASSNPDGSSRVDYTGDQYVVVKNAPNMVATLSQSLAPESGDNEYVDYSKVNVYVVIKIVPAACGVSCSDTPTWTSGNLKIANRSDWATTGTGYAQTTGPKTLSEGSYMVIVDLVANGFIVAERATETLDVASATGTFVTGGGFVPTDSTSNAANKNGNFAFNVKGLNKALQGNAIYIFRMRMDVSTSTDYATKQPTNLVPCATLSSVCRDVDIIIRSNKLNALNTGTATTYPMTGYATGQFAVQFTDAQTGVHYDGSQSPYKLEFGNGSFRLDLTDNASGGTTDTYGYSAYNPDGSLFHQANLGPIPQTGTNAMTNQVTLGGGNVSVHK